MKLHRGGDVMDEWTDCRLPAVVSAMLLATGLLASSPAMARPPSYQTTGFAHASAGNSEFLETLGSVSAGQVTAAGTSHATANSTANQFVSSTASAFGSGVAAASEASVAYYFSVVGPSGNSVPLKFSGSGSVTDSGSAASAAFMDIYVNDVPYYFYDPACAGGTCPGSFNYATTISVTSGNGLGSGVGATGRIVLKASTIASDNGAASAWIDPFVTVDPTFGDANLYSVQFSPGVTQGGAAVPEPDTWSLMMLGVGGVGAVLRTGRRRLKT